MTPIDAAFQQWLDTTNKYGSLHREAYEAGWKDRTEYIRSQGAAAWYLSCEGQLDTLDFDADGWSPAWTKQPLYKLPEDV
jgi:hypothetical protein